MFLPPSAHKIQRLEGGQGGKGERTSKRPSFSPATEISLSLLGKMGKELPGGEI